MNIYVFNALFFGFSVFLISLIVLLKREDEIGKRWFYFCVVVAVWAVLYSFTINNDIRNEFGLLTARANNTASAFIPPTWLYFVCGFLNIKRRKIFWFSWMVTGFILLISPTDLFIPSVSPTLRFAHYMDPGPLYHLHPIHFFAVVSYGFYLMIVSFRQECSNERKKEIALLLLATSFGFLGGSTSYAMVYFRQIGFDLTLLLSIYPFLMAYIMIKHRVLDIEKLTDAFQREKLATVGILAASVNHELKNPLYIARGTMESYLKNLEDGVYRDAESQTAAKKAIGISLEQLARASEIMQKLTDFARPSTGGDRMEEVHVRETLEHVVELAGSHLALNKVLFLNEASENSVLFGNRHQFEEIFFNLIINASQAMKGGGKLEVRAEQSNGTVRIEIADQGPGVPPDQLFKIFQPFYTTKDSGTGLGLYITKQLVERNKGRITVKSRLNHGTQFILNFPTRERETDKLPRPL